MNEGAARMSFEERGVISISKKDKNGKPIDKERAEEIAIEAGAEEVVDENEPPADGQEQTGGGDVIREEETWTIYTGANDFLVAKGTIDKMPDVDVMEAEIRFIPVTQIPLSPEDLEAATSLIQTLREMDEVNDIFDNIKYEE